MLNAAVLAFLASVDPSTSTISSANDSVVRAAEPDVRACWSDEAAAAKLAIVWRVDAAGLITKLEVTPVPAADIGACVERVVRSIPVHSQSETEVRVTLAPSSFDVAISDISGLTRSQIQGVVAPQIPRIKACYEAELTHRDVTGKVILVWVIAADGTVASLAAQGDVEALPQTTTCASAIVRAMRFPAPKGGGVVNVTYPFVFDYRDVDDAPRSGGRCCLSIQDAIWPPTPKAATSARAELPLDVLRPSSRDVLAHVAFVGG